MEIVFICTHLVMAVCATVILSISFGTVKETESPIQKRLLRKLAATNYEVLRDTTTPIVKSNNVGFPAYSKKEANWLTQNA